jgi:L-threonylcarbamoyladenylate synthase
MSQSAEPMRHERPEIIVVDPVLPDPAIIAQAAGVIRGGGLVGMPTETVYGLAANALDPAAIARVYSAKGRPSHNPLIAHVADANGARHLAAEWPIMAQALAARFWPGPLTLVVRRKAMVPAELTAGLDTFGVRVPDHPVALALIRAVGLPLAAPSANKFTEVSPVTAQQVARGLGGAVNLILDAGRTRVGIESTVVDVSGATPIILRPGMISREEIEGVVGPAGRASTSVGVHDARPSPGMIARHYAPRAQVRLVATEDLDAVLSEAELLVSHGKTIGVLLCGRTLPPRAPFTFAARLGDDPALYAAGLYDALHGADAHHCEQLIVEAPPSSTAWDAIRDRLQRAAHP